MIIVRSKNRKIKQNIQVTYKSKLTIKYPFSLKSDKVNNHNIIKNLFLIFIQSQVQYLDFYQIRTINADISIQNDQTHTQHNHLNEIKQQLNQKKFQKIILQSQFFIYDIRQIDSQLAS
ncbi:hypothetical protein ABPG72_004287 [Tetrahymena utriculariae]